MSLQNTGITPLWVMFEGKNIHFSPTDKKPLCSYSGKICRQRRLNGYAFCIRHILEDKSAPFKQCSYVTRNNSQKCLNAIPSNQDRGYCHSHMQVIGILPKTKRKSKKFTPDSDPESVFRFEEDSSDSTDIYSYKSGMSKKSPVLKNGFKSSSRVVQSSIRVQKKGNKLKPCQSEQLKTLKKFEGSRSVTLEESGDAKLNIFPCLEISSNTSPTPPLNSNNNIVKSDEINLTVSENDARHEYLAHVRNTFKSQFQTIKKSSTQEVDKRCSQKKFRDSVMRCVRIDSSVCAQVLRGYRGKTVCANKTKLRVERANKTDHEDASLESSFESAFEVESLKFSGKKVENKAQRQSCSSPPNKASDKSKSVKVTSESTPGKEKLKKTDVVIVTPSPVSPRHNQELEFALTPDGVITDASFDSTFDHSTSSQQDGDFSDDEYDDLDNFNLEIDPEIQSQASRLLEDNGLTEADFTELFPDNRMNDMQEFDANDIDYSLFANIFPNLYTIPIPNQF